MNRYLMISVIASVSLAIFSATPATADTFFFSTGNPDGLIATLSVPASPGRVETETADDFVLTQTTTITGATFTGLLPLSAPLSNVQDVAIELYHVFPVDSANPPSGDVLTRVNSPSDVEFAAFDKVAGTLSETPGLLSPSFTVPNTVVDGINPFPNQFTGGEGPATGGEVQFNVALSPGITLPAGHYFFRPEVQLTDGNFLWLSAPKPILPPGTPFPLGAPDLQTWIRNGHLAPDWSRIGTDITHQGPFNAAFSLSGTVSGTVPEPSTLLLLGTGVAVLVIWRRKQIRGR